MEATDSLTQATDPQPDAPDVPQSPSLWDELEEAWDILGTGYHVCPGAPHIGLAAVDRLEELLQRVRERLSEPR